MGMAIPNSHGSSIRSSLEEALEKLDAKRKRAEQDVMGAGIEAAQQFEARQLEAAENARKLEIARSIGAFVTDAPAGSVHTVNDPGHSHCINDPCHSHGYSTSWDAIFNRPYQQVAEKDATLEERRAPPWARAGERLTCVEGHHICTVACDIRASSTHRHGNFKDWCFGEEPAIGSAPTCQCGAIWIRYNFNLDLNEYHFEDGWR